MQQVWCTKKRRGGSLKVNNFAIFRCYQ